MLSTCPLLGRTASAAVGMVRFMRSEASSDPSSSSPATISAGTWVRAVAAAGDGEGKRAIAVHHAEMQRRKGAHRQPDDVRALDAERIEHAADVVAGTRLRVALELLRDVGGRIAARVIRDAAIAAREMAQLRLPAAMIARELVDEHDGCARAGVFIVEPHAVVRGNERVHCGILCR